MRKFLLMAAAAMLVPLCASGEGFLDNVLRYSFESGSTTRVYVSGMWTTVADVTIPSTVTYEYLEYDSNEGKYVTRHRTCTVTGIGNSAFIDRSAIKSVTISDSVTSIGSSAFRGCSGLSELSLPSSVTAIDSYTFRGCTGLRHVTIPDSVTSIGYDAFDNCSNLVSVVIPASVTSIGNYAFWGCKSLTEVTIPGGVSYVGDWAFVYCSGLSDVTISEGVKSIGESAFYSCSALTRVSLPESLTYIGSSAFDNCYLISDLSIPSGVTEIGDSAFRNCQSLTEVRIPDGLTRIGNNLFYSCWNLTEVTIPPAVTNIGESAFMYCSGLAKVEIGNSAVRIGQNAFSECARIKDVTVPQYVCTAKLSTVFSSYLSVTNVTILDGVTSIDGYAFSGCTGLSHVSIPDSVTSIGNSAFNGCTNLVGVVIPVSVTSIGNYAFNSCKSLTEVTIPGGVSYVGDSAFSFCSGLSDVTISEGVRSVGNNAFSSCGALTRVSLPESLTYIGDYAFYYTGLTRMTIPDGVTYVGSSAFSGCVRLGEITLPSSLTSIKGNTFANCYSLTTMTIPASVTNIESSAFYSCSQAGAFKFRGLPPNAYYAFSSVKQNAHGYYLPENREAWQAVIVNGRWNGLIMEEAPVPRLMVDSANIPENELTLKWEYTGPIDGIEYTIYRNTTDDLSTATNVATGTVSAVGTYVERNFMSIAPQTLPLHYWIVTRDSVTGAEESAHVVTRRRFLLSVGFTGYSRPLFEYATPLPQTFNDARSLKSHCETDGGFKDCHLKKNVKRDTLIDEMKLFSDMTQPGDIFIFYIGSHGDVSDDSAHLVMYRQPDYAVNELQKDVRRFNPGVAVVGIIFACHSGAMTGQPVNSGITEWLTKCGFNQCLGNVAWITSCEAFQYSALPDVEGAFTYFGESLIKDGLMGAYADQRLYGTEYDGGNYDGKITMGELGRYAQVFVKGIRNYPADVQLENEGLLDRIVMKEGVSCTTLSPPDAPMDVSVSKGRFDLAVKVSWTAYSTHKYYWVYRYPVSSPSQITWVDLFNPLGRSGSCNWYDPPNGWGMESPLPFGRYGYRVRAVTPIGISELSQETVDSIGWRGSQAYKDFLSVGVALLRGNTGTVESGTIEEYASAEGMVAPNGFTFGNSWVAGLDPTNETSKFTVNMTMTNGSPFITWSPNLNTNGEVRTYTVWGKTNLTDGAWHTPTNSASRFFKVTVEMP